MNEAFLHYIWHYQYFNKRTLKTTEGDPVVIFTQGSRNANAGPDFLNARIQIGKIEWIGHVEIHLKSSGWHDHKHQQDSAYNNVILHVVWEDDKPVMQHDDTYLPTIELKHRVDDSLWEKYKLLLNSGAEISCAGLWNTVKPYQTMTMINRALVQRLESKSDHVLDKLKQQGMDWMETTYVLLCRSFGFNINAEAMERLAEVTPYKYLLKHRDQPGQVESFLLGQAGFLDDAKENDPYALKLLREHAILSSKYRLGSKKLTLAHWKFLRLRPANFPTLRIAQFAQVVSSVENLFSALLGIENFKQAKQLLEIDANPYWSSHYLLSKKSNGKVATHLGETSIENIIINTIVPLQFSYGRYYDDEVYRDRAFSLLENIRFEHNKITALWESLTISKDSAVNSQGLIELYNHFCMKRKCLDCSVGAALVRPAS